MRRSEIIQGICSRLLTVPQLASGGGVDLFRGQFMDGSYPSLRPVAFVEWASTAWDEGDMQQGSAVISVYLVVDTSQNGGIDGEYPSLVLLDDVAEALHGFCPCENVGVLCRKADAQPEYGGSGLACYKMDFALSIIE
ncbi:MAG: hypothetical protein PHD21_06770 [Flavobacteriales bacterium]|nr:hypothetical protein [Flavobacteriales bacterium]